MTQSSPTGLDPDVLLAIYASTLEPRAAVYCSAPITSGRRYIDWASKYCSAGTVDSAIRSNRSEHFDNVVAPNIEHARTRVARLRSEHPHVSFIDPTVVPHISTWEQSNWLRFWENVIGRFCFAAVFVEAWEYSFGCTHEFVFAQTLGIPTFDERGNPLETDDATRLVTAACDDIENAGVSAVSLRSTLQMLEFIPALDFDMSLSSCIDQRFHAF